MIRISYSSSLVPAFRPNRLFIFTLFWFALACTVLSGCGNAPPKSRMEKRTCLYLNSLVASSVDLARAFDDVAGAKRLNTRDRMIQAGEMVRTARSCLYRARKDTRQYTAFITANRSALQGENLQAYIRIRYLLNGALRTKRRAMEDYLLKMDNWLRYAADHYDRLKAGHPGARRNYDALFLQASRSLDRYNDAGEAYRQTVRQFLSENPELKKRFKKRYKTMRAELGWP